MIKGAIFDLDGTLLDSMFIWDTIGEVYLHSLDIEPRENLAETFKTFTLEESAEYYRTHYGVSLSVAEIVDGVNRMIEDLYKTTVPLKKGVAEFLAGLSKAGVRMCIATVTDKYLVEAALTRLKVRQYFGEIITTAEVGCHQSMEHVLKYEGFVLFRSKISKSRAIDLGIIFPTANLGGGKDLSYGSCLSWNGKARNPRI